jgi:hypothetical protein
LVYEVTLITDEEEDGIFLSIGLYFVHPKLANVLKADWVGEIEDEEYTLTASVIGTCDGPEALLPSSVPYLKFNVFGIYLYSFKAEVYSDGSEVVF